MHVDARQQRAILASLRAKGGRGPWIALLGELLRLSGGYAELLRHEEHAWASATFAGTRHRFALEFEGPDAVAAGERWIARIADHEFAIPGQLVADAAVVSVTHETCPLPRITLEAEFLLLEED